MQRTNRVYKKGSPDRLPAQVGSGKLGEGGTSEGLVKWVIWYPSPHPE